MSCAQDVFFLVVKTINQTSVQILKSWICRENRIRWNEWVLFVGWLVGWFKRVNIKRKSFWGGETHGETEIARTQLATLHLNEQKSQRPLGICEWVWHIFLWYWGCWEDIYKSDEEFYFIIIYLLVFSRQGFSVWQTGFHLTEICVSQPPQVLRLKTCTTTAPAGFLLSNDIYFKNPNSFSQLKCLSSPTQGLWFTMLIFIIYLARGTQPTLKHLIPDIWFVGCIVWSISIWTFFVIPLYCKSMK